MAQIDGIWEVVTRTPMGDQVATLTLVCDGATFTGRSVSVLGVMELENGRIDGDSISWTMQLTMPMNLKLEGRATIQGDELRGELNAGFMGRSQMTGKRIG